MLAFLKISLFQSKSAPVHIKVRASGSGNHNSHEIWRPSFGVEIGTPLDKSQEKSVKRSVVMESGLYADWNGQGFENSVHWPGVQWPILENSVRSGGGRGITDIRATLSFSDHTCWHVRCRAVVIRTVSDSCCLFFCSSKKGYSSPIGALQMDTWFLCRRSCPNAL